MVSKIRRVLEQNRVVLENFSFLGILQITNLLIFIILIPFFFRVLGKENYGLVVFAQTTALFFSILINFGFNATATRDISVWRNDKERKAEIISTVLLIKSLLFAIALILLTILIIIIPLLSDHFILFYLSMLACLSEALFPLWYFQGIEKMSYLTYINVATRIFSSLLIFFLIKAPQDYYLVPLFLGAGTVSGALIGLYILFMVHKNNFYILSPAKLKSKIRENFPVFISNLSSQIYVNSNKLIIGSLLGVKDVAVYDVGERIMNLVKVPLYVLGQAIFPDISRKRNIKYINQALLIVISFYMVVTITVIILAPYIALLMTGSADTIMVSVMRVLIMSVVPVTFSMFFTDLRLVPFEYYSEYAKTRLLSLFLYLTVAMALIFSKHYTLLTFSWAILVVEVFVVVTAIFFCYKRKILY